MAGRAAAGPSTACNQAPERSHSACWVKSLRIAKVDTRGQHGGVIDLFRRRTRATRTDPRRKWSNAPQQCVQCLVPSECRPRSRRSGCRSTSATTGTGSPPTTPTGPGSQTCGPTHARSAGPTLAERHHAFVVNAVGPSSEPCNRSATRRSTCTGRLVADSHQARPDSQRSAPLRPLPAAAPNTWLTRARTALRSPRPPCALQGATLPMNVPQLASSVLGASGMYSLANQIVPSLSATAAE
jgi:hypothetical protein